jgi:pyruvate dehydrogenase E2 component (dihydrolipoamide acetyltransferase)
MPETLFLPKWGMTMTEGRISRWLKQVGDAVAAEEEVVEVETDKVLNVLTAPVAGKLTAILVPEGETVPVGTELGTITPDA